MPRFFVPIAAVSSGRCIIEGADAAHLLRSLRVRIGETLSVADDGGREHAVRITAVRPSRIETEVVWSRPVTGEPRLQLHVVQALPRHGADDAVDAIAQTGARAIHPVLSERTVARPDERRAARRGDRWQTIARDAAGLAYRGMPPTVHPLADLEAALGQLPEDVRLLVCAVEMQDATAVTMLDLEGGRPLAICIGPEGGWGTRDLAIFHSAAAEAVHLGPRVYRARLAGAIACAMLLARAGDCDQTVSMPPDHETSCRCDVDDCHR